MKGFGAEMNLELRNIFQNEGEILALDTEMDLSDLDIGGIYPLYAPVHVHGQIGNRAGIVSLSVVSDFLYRAPCDRCCEMTDRNMSVGSEHVLVADLNDSENDELFLIPDMNLDFDDLIRSDILLEIPMKYLCSPDCKGICMTCGKNLNNGLCGCKKQTDSRFDVLKQLLD